MRRFINFLSLVFVSSMVSLSLTACGNDELNDEDGDVIYVTTYEVKLSPTTLNYFSITGDYINEKGEITDMDLSRSVHHFELITTSTIPDHLQIHVNLEPYKGWDQYTCIVELGIETKKYSKIGEYIETVYSDRREMCNIINYPAEKMERNHFVSDFTLEAKKDKQGRLN